ncbi:609_t:CDS:2, partial [Cetraspora pellucida]
NQVLKKENISIKKELETFKNPGISFLKLMLNNKSWKKIKKVEELANKKAENMKIKKETATLKWTNYELKKA